MRDAHEINDFITYHASDACNDAIDYDHAYEVLADEDGEQFDLFVRLAYEFSERAPKFSNAQRIRFAKSFANLAVSALSFNVSQSDACADAQDAIQDAISEASQISR